MRQIHRAVAAAVITTFIAANALAIWTPPGEHWEQYVNPAEAGWDAEGLTGARAYADEIGSAAVMVVHRGVVVDSWGDLTRRYMCHSTRKSYLSALLGVYIEDGTIDYTMTLDELGIDDFEPSLSETEKSARIVDLMAARSGVYRTAAYEPARNPKPPRHSSAPNETWCYNNWDFNTLSTIFRQITGEDVFEAFNSEIAMPLGMEDYGPRDGYYHYQRNMSNHPAYPFRMSTRDMARFGQLFLNRGWWGETSILSESWIDESTDAISTETWTGGYGYMWWTYHGTEWEEYGLFTALGAGGHAIAVFPELDLVIVHRVNTFEGMNVPRPDFMSLFRKIIEAMPAFPVDNAARETLPSGDTCPDGIGVPLNDLLQFVGSYDTAGGNMRVTCDGNTLVLRQERSGNFSMIPLGENSFTLEDSFREIVFEQIDGEWMLFSEQLAIREGINLLRAGEIAEARAAVMIHLDRYPESAFLYNLLGDIDMTAGDEEAGLASYRKSLKLNPGNDRLAQALQQIESEREERQAN